MILKIPVKYFNYKKLIQIGKNYVLLRIKFTISPQEIPLLSGVI